MYDQTRVNSEIDRRRFPPLAGAWNFRELGGYAGVDGRKVIWGRLFRSGDLEDLTEADLDSLAAIGLRTVLDFRRPQELNNSPDRLPSTVELVFNIPVDPGDFQTLIDNNHQPDGRRLMEDLNRLMVREFIEPFSRFLALAAEKEAAPLLFHCTAGKDRTGLAAALLLGALGASRADIVHDYLLSGPGLGDKYARLLARRPDLGPFLRPQASYLESALEAIDQEFGGLERYLTENLKADLPALRSLYLE